MDTPIPKATDIALGDLEAKRMIEFAKAHVKNALRIVAKQQVPPEYYGQEPRFRTSVDKETILNAYPETWIQ